MRSNCHLEAWRRYRSGEAIGFCFRPTRFSKLQAVICHPLAFPIRIVGWALQWICWPLTHVGELLRSGKWYHVMWIDKHGDRWEFVMIDRDDNIDQRTQAFAPPLVFRGKVQRAED